MMNHRSDINAQYCTHNEGKLRSSLIYYPDDRKCYDRSKEEEDDACG